MSWKETISKTSLIERGRANVETRRPGYAQQQTPTTDCRITDCAATDCINNKNRKCALPTVTISAQFTCNQYTKKAPVMK